MLAHCAEGGFPVAATIYAGDETDLLAGELDVLTKAPLPAQRIPGAGAITRPGALPRHWPCCWSLLAFVVFTGSPQCSPGRCRMKPRLTL